MDTCSKYFFSLINVFIFVCSLVLFAFATWMAYGSTFREVVTSDQGALLVFYAIYVLAGMLFALALITMLTDCRKKRSTRIAHMLATFIYLTFFFGFVAYGVSNVSSVESKLSEIWDSQSDTNKQLIETRLSCCGFSSYTEYTSPYHTSCLQDPTNAASDPWQTGCGTALLPKLTEYYQSLVALLSILIVFQVFQIIVDMILIRQMGGGSAVETKEPL